MGELNMERPAGAATSAGLKDVHEQTEQLSDNPTESNGQDSFYRPKAIKRKRRSKSAVTSVRDAIVELADNPQTVRQVFYAMTVAGLIQKTEGEYKQTIVRLLVDMRERGIIPFEYIADNTRWMRKPSTFIGIDDFLTNGAKAYRRDLWESMDVYVEIWCEKDALAGVIVGETEPYDVPLMVSRGYSSLSFLHSAAETIISNDKPAYIYHFGDFDPSGQDAARDIEEKLRRYAPEAEIHFERIAVTPEQIKTWDLPSRPTKLKDPRAKKWTHGASVELDAIPARELRKLVKDCIERHIDQQQLAIMRVADPQAPEPASPHC
jgi:hypothetical protein